MRTLLRGPQIAHAGSTPVWAIRSMSGGFFISCRVLCVMGTAANFRRYPSPVSRWDAVRYFPCRRGAASLPKAVRLLHKLTVFRRYILIEGLLLKLERLTPSVMPGMTPPSERGGVFLWKTGLLGWEGGALGRNDRMTIGSRFFGCASE